MISTKCAFFAAVLALATLGPLHASLIAWGTPTTITGNSDVSNAGTLVNAINFYSTTTPVNGVTFNFANPTGSTFTSGDFTLTGGSFGTSSDFTGANGSGNSNGSPFNTMSLAYQEVLGTSVNNPGTLTLTMSGLVSGDVYQFQFWTQTYGNIDVIETALAGNSVAVQSDVTSNVGGLGQYAIGTFTADSSLVQTVTFTGNYIGNSFIDAAQLRNLTVVPVPEPEPAWAMGVFLAGVCAFRRKQAAA